MCIATIIATTVSIATAVGTAVASAATAVGAAVGTVGAAVGSAAATIGTALGATSATAATVVGGTVLGVGALGIGSTVVGGIMGTVSAVQSAEAQQQQAEYQAQMAEQNAKLSYRQAEKTELAANQKRAALLQEYQADRGTSRANFAAGGVVLGSGTAAEYEADLANAYDLDLRNLNYDTANEVWQQKVTATSYSNQAAMYRAQAENYNSQKYTSLFGGIANTAGNALSSASNLGLSIAKFSGSSNTNKNQLKLA